MKFKGALILMLSLVFVIGAMAKTLPNAEQAPLNKKEQKLIEKLSADKAGERMEAAQELAKRGCKLAKDHLIKMMKNDDAYQARIVAAMALMKMECKDALPDIKKQAEKDPSKIVRNALSGVVKEMEQSS